MTDTTTQNTQAINIEKNLKVFKENLPNLLKTEQGKYVLLSDEKIVGVYDTVRDAKTTGDKFFERENYSIQQVLSTPINLGYFSYASSVSATQ